MQSIRDNALYAYGYLQGRFFSLPHSPADLYGRAISKITSVVTLPLPLLSFLALPFFGGSPATLNFVVFYLTWAAFVASHDPQTVEVGGTLLVRLVCFLLPALGFLAFDCVVPKLSRSFKARGEKQLPLKLGRDKLLEVALVVVFNVLLSVALQAALEYAATELLHMRSLLKVTSTVPLPWNILKDLAKGIFIRGCLRYAIHRYVLHTYDSPLRAWHLNWQHSVRLPFSLVAAYDHPVNYLLSQWLPVFAPAYLFRYHVLTWHLLLAIASLEELFIYSGYDVLPSNILIPGMARRIDAHFETVNGGQKAGNFGNLGLVDLMMGTTCDKESDVLDDLQSEAAKHQVQQRVDEAVKGALAGIQGEKSSNDDVDDGDDVDEKPNDAHGRADGAIDGDVGGGAAEEDATEQAPRRSRRKGRKA